ncbi:MAG: radical SAM protein, partial [Deltaproteobacteria bacterium]|nr:radical SAM protein [Deltaproteobacteria bacterium]
MTEEKAAQAGKGGRFTETAFNQDPVGRRIYSLRLQCSNLCNQRCTYCHVFKDGRVSGKRSPGLMDLGVATAALDAFARLTRIQGNAHVRIGFYGGEPLLNWKTIRQALRHGEQIFTDRENLHWILNTNGTLLTPEIVRLLKEWNVDVHISLDGPDGLSNRYRRFKSGRPVHHRVRESLEIIRAFGCRLQLDSCLTEANLSSLKGLIDLAWQTGADRIYLALIDSPEINAIDQMDRTEVARTLVEAGEYGRKRGVSVGGPWKRAIDG